MPKRASFFKPNFVTLATIGVTALSAGCFGSNGLPKVGTAAYRQTVTAFTIGTVALETANLNLIEPNLKKATELAPGEPATWANLGLHYLRTNRTPEAEAVIKKANDLGGTSDGLTLLSGLLAEKQGKFEAALAQYQKAADANPRNVKAWYLVAQLADRLNGADRIKVMAGAYDKVLAILPGNTKTLFDRLRIAADANDRPVITAILTSLSGRTAEWPDRAKALFTTLTQTATTAPVVVLKRNTAMLENNLGQYPDFQASKREVSFDGANVGQPLSRFVKLENPSATPSPADLSLTYRAAGSASSQVMLADYVTAFPLDDLSSPVLVTVAKTEIRVGSATARVPLGMTSVVATDLDDAVGRLENEQSPRNFKLDLVAVGSGGLRAFDSSKGTLADRTTQMGLGTLSNTSMNGALSLDFEADGDLDVLLAPSSGGCTLLLNKGNGAFAITKNPFPNLLSTIQKLALCDIDADGDNDVFLVGVDGTLSIYRNDRSGLYTNRPAPAGVTRVKALAVRESTGDATLDVLAVDDKGAVHIIADAGDGLRWANDNVLLTGRTGATQLITEDCDNNGAIDVVIGYDNQGKVASSVHLAKNITTFELPADVPGRISALVDLNKDGLLDAVCTTGGAVQIMEATAKKAYKWQAFTLKAKRPNSPTVKINAFAIGGEVEIRAGLLYQKQAITGPQVHIGLGEDGTLDIVRIIWPSGTAQSEAGTDLKLGPMVADQRLTGSCPFLFTWDGEKMVFVTDCIWRSPLGLKINAQDTAGVSQTEDWVKVRGDQLRAKDGVYSLSVTAELQETHFFDTVGLMVVDHPKGTDIWVDERFSPTAPPLLEIIPTKTPQAFATVRGWKDTDVAALVASRDSLYVDDFGRSKYQGVTGDHWIEMELPKGVPTTKPLYVVASGWLHPTDTSVNVAMAQNPNQPRPSGLVLEGLTTSGKWIPLKQGLGFPAGKLKTVCLRFDDVSKGVTKLRLRTNLEIYWDQLRWAEGVDRSVLRVTRAQQQAADLVYRGFSDVRPKDISSPELPQSYEKLAGCAPVWQDLTGFHTRFGDISTLVSSLDDRYVIMNAGDEMKLKFNEVPLSAAGLVRDYVFIGDGWEKDGNLNTTFGKTVLPLPTHKRADYPTLPKTLDDDPVYQIHAKDWVDFHTRFVTPYIFRNAFRLHQENH